MAPPPPARRRRPASLLALLAAALLLPAPARAAPGACSGHFGPSIEGASVDAAGRVYAVAWGRPPRLNAFGAASGPACGLAGAVDDRPGALINGLRFLPNGDALAADRGTGRVARVPAGGGRAATLCAGGGLATPNDLALSRTGAVYISSQRSARDTRVGDGGVWRCFGVAPRNGSAPGRAERLAALGRTNGIELSPDDRYLYVSEAFSKRGAVASMVILRYALRPDGRLGAKSLFHDFGPGVRTDGMRADAAGNLYVAVNGGRRVEVLAPEDGRTLRTLCTSFAGVVNVELGGADGRTLYAVGRCGADPAAAATRGCVDEFPGQPHAGRAWTLLQEGLPAAGAARGGR
jgi:gluconolactonase